MRVKELPDYKFGFYMYAVMCWHGLQTGKENTYIMKSKTGDVTQRNHWTLRKHKRSGEGPLRPRERPTFNQVIQLLEICCWKIADLLCS